MYELRQFSCIPSRSRRAPPPPARPLDYFKPSNTVARRGAEVDAHFAVSFQANTSEAYAHGEWPGQITSGRR
jgi:hypothetical protein